jgi:hypothetical protein
MTAALPFASLPLLIQEASARKPRRAAAKHCSGAPGNFPQNNYRAGEVPNWGRNRKGAGAPRGNRNALCSRIHHQIQRLRAYRLQQHEKMLHLARRLAQLEASLQGKTESGEQLSC